MKEGVYFAEVGESSCKAMHLDEDAVQSRTLSTMFQRKEEKETAIRSAAARTAKIERARWNHLVRDCTGLTAVSAVAYAVYRLGLPAAVAAITVCTGLMIYRLGKFYGRKSGK